MRIEDLLRSKLESSLGAKEKFFHGTQEVKLKPFTVPSLEGLKVVVPPMRPIEPVDIEARLMALADLYTEVEDRGQEPAELGDILEIDLIGYENGAVVPGSVHRNAEFRLSEDEEIFSPLIPALIGARANTVFQPTVTIPFDFELPELRGRTMSFAITVHRVMRPHTPDLNDPEFIASLGLGETIDDVAAAALEVLEEEFEERYVAEVEEQVVNALLERVTDLELPVEVVDYEIRKRWQQSEGDALEAWGVTPDGMRQSLMAWLTDPSRSARAARDIMGGIVVAAVGQEAGISITEAQFHDFVRAFAEDEELPFDDALKLFESDEGLMSTTFTTLFMRASMDYIMSAVEVTVDKTLPSQSYPDNFGVDDFSDDDEGTATVVPKGDEW